jgi:tetratricopeptide (TPR) repeat protein
MKKALLAIAVFAGALHALAFDESAATQLFEQANQAYEEERYEEAFNLYDSVATQYTSFELFFNAGNAAYRSGKLGQSILYYERAKRIDPSNDDLLLNLTLADERVKDRIQELPSLGVEDLWTVLTASNRLPLWSTLAILANLIGFALLVLWLWSKRRNVKRGAFWAGAVLILIGFVGYGMSRATYSRIKAATEAVILAPKVEVKNSPSSNDSNAFVLHEGTRVKILQESEEWFEVRIANGSVGWMPRSSAEVI